MTPVAVFATAKTGTPSRLSCSTTSSARSQHGIALIIAVVGKGYGFDKIIHSNGYDFEHLVDKLSSFHDN
jgi:hypothetical protein